MQYGGPIAFLVLLYLHCTLRNSEPLERLFPASSYWTPTKVKEKLDYLSINGGYANVEVTQSYVDYVDEEEDEENMTLGNVIRRRIQKKKMKEQEEKITVAAVIRKKIDKKKMRSDVTLKKKKKITKKKSDVQQLEVSTILDHSEKGKTFCQEKFNETEVRDNVSTILDHSEKGKTVCQEKCNETEVRDNGDFYKNDNVNEDWMDSGPSVPRFDIILDEVNEDAEVSDELRTFKKKNEDVQDSEEIGDVQLDQLLYSIIKVFHAMFTDEKYCFQEDGSN
ncbi:hypothetical protein L2E82_18271 [Cichorium intybus]|uniref:Uncharacterized protein n=1 Tax=Cichorium intybus TaxID=13427 RepID=A0ACB9F9W9_CICIN|nr:hypothetical protein L2E82_18271 [Cichorium intybus]